MMSVDWSHSIQSTSGGCAAVHDRVFMKQKSRSSEGVCIDISVITVCRRNWNIRHRYLTSNKTLKSIKTSRRALNFVLYPSIASGGVYLQKDS